jgi:hypothetical protein
VGVVPTKVRTSGLGLVLVESAGRFLAADDHPIGWPPEAMEALVAGNPEVWGTDALRQVVPSLAQHAARAIRCAKEINDTAHELGIELCTGECEVRGEDLGGITRHIAARVSEVRRGVAEEAPAVSPCAPRDEQR